MTDHWENHSPNHWSRSMGGLAKMNELRMTTHWPSHSPNHWPPNCSRSIAIYRALTQPENNTTTGNFSKADHYAGDTRTKADQSRPPTPGSGADRVGAISSSTQQKTNHLPHGPHFPRCLGCKRLAQKPQTDTIKVDGGSVPPQPLRRPKRRPPTVWPPDGPEPVRRHKPQSGRATRDYSSQCMSVPFAELPNLSREFMTLLCDSHLRRRFGGAPLGPKRHLSLRTSF